MRGAVERDAAKTFRRLIGRADGEEEFPLWRELADGMVAVICAVHGIIGTKVNGVGAAAEQPFAPRPQKIALTVEDDDWMLPARDQIDVVLGVHVDACDLNIAPALR